MVPDVPTESSTYVWAFAGLCWSCLGESSFLPFIFVASVICTTSGPELNKQLRLTWEKNRVNRMIRIITLRLLFFLLCVNYITILNFWNSTQINVHYWKNFWMNITLIFLFFKAIFILFSLLTIQKKQ